MSGMRGFIAFVVLVLVAIATYSVRADQKSERNDADFWTAERVWTFHVTIGEADWNQLQPQRPSRWAGMFGGNRGPASRPATEPAEPDAPPRNQGRAGKTFNNVELPYVFSKVDFEGQTFDSVGVRFKGNSSYAQARNSPKKPFKLDFNRYLDDGDFPAAGPVTLLNFNNNAMDPSQAREALAYKVFRDAGVPAPRTAYARVYVTVPSVHVRKYLGLYTIVEEVNKEFLKQHFDSTKGLLLKPEGVSGFKYLGDDWSHYHARYDPRSATRKNTRRFVEFLKLVDKADDEAFRARIDVVLDLDAFARFLAANVVLSNTDSFLASGHNYYLYLDPKTEKLHFIPWDLNLSLGGFMLAGSTEQQTDLSVDAPHAAFNNLARRLLALDDFRASYRGHVERIVAHHFRPDRLNPEIERIERLTQGAIEEEKKAGDDLGDRAMGPWRPVDLKTFVAGRTRSIEDQLAGKSKGTAPRAWRGPPATAPATAPAIPLAAPKTPPPAAETVSENQS